MCITSPYCHSAAYQQLNLTGLTGDPPFKPKTCCLRRAVCVCVCCTRGSREVGEITPGKSPMHSLTTI